MKTFFLIDFILFFTSFSFSQDTLKFLFTPTEVVAGESVIYGVSMTGLNTLWYKNYEHTSFHWFDDSSEWLQMDKFGHGFSAFYLSDVSTSLFGKTKLETSNLHILMGSISAWTYITTIEIFDGFSTNWGASYSDIIANTIGVGFFAFQKIKFEKLFVVPKFSFHQTSLAGYRPDLLGKNLSQNLLKDYNGQTYWLSVNFSDIVHLKRIPRWINFAFGYSATGMLGGKENPSYLPSYNRTRRFLFSLDIDFRKIPTKSKILQKTFRLINFIKFPFPAIMLENKQIKFSNIYF